MTKIHSIIAPEGGGRHKTVPTMTGPGWARIVVNPSSMAAPSVELTVTQGGQVYLELRDANSVGTSYLVGQLNDDGETWTRRIQVLGG